jgi:hypothetical protein
MADRTVREFAIGAEERSFHVWDELFKNRERSSPEHRHYGKVNSWALQEMKLFMLRQQMLQAAQNS